MAIPTIHLINDAIGQRTINRVYEKCRKQGREPTLDDINKEWCKRYGDYPYKQMPKYDKKREKGAGNWLDLFFN